jgi:excisionase family DNA binding protein
VYDIENLTIPVLGFKEINMNPLIGIGALSDAVGLHPNWLRELADRGEIPSIRTVGGQRRFNLADVQSALALRGKKAPHRQSAMQGAEATQYQWRKNFKIAGLSEDLVFQEIIESLGLDMKEKSADIIPYAFTEMLNNAIEHSRGKSVAISFNQSQTQWSFKIQDDGQGAFHNIKSTFHLSSNIEAIAELTKGKRTTAAHGHSGEGIFFTSKAVDSFRIESDGLAWTVNNLIDDFTVEECPNDPGTTVICSIDRNTTRTLQSVFERFTKDHNFTRSRPSIKLFETGMMFVSRSEARRLVVGLEKFSEVELDFSQVKSVGQGFVDEVFRVWATAHPETKFFPVNMSTPVEFMVLRGLPKV